MPYSRSKLEKLFAIPLLIVLSLIFLRWQYGVLLFHTVAELFSVIVGILMLVVVWNTRHFTRNDFLIYLGIGYFWIAFLDAWHTFTVKGMPFFDIVNAEPTLHFWIYARLIEALLILSAPIFLTRNLNAKLMLYLGAILSFIIIFVSLNIKQPVMLTAEGLTVFKITTEYLIMFILSVSAVIYIIKRKLFAKNVLNYLLISIVLTIFAEFFFTQYNDFYGVPFTIGHLFKLLSFWMIYQAIISTTLKEPFSVMAQAYNSYDAIPHATVVVDNQGLISQLNRQAAQSTGLAKEQLIHQNIHKYFHPQNVPINSCELCKHIKKGQSLELNLVPFPEKKQWFVISLAPIMNGNRNSGMVQSATDITAQVLANQKQEKSEKLLKSVINATPDWIFIKDTQFRYLFVNESLSDALNIPVDEFKGKTDEEVGFSKELVFGDESKGIRGFRADDEDVINGLGIHNSYDPATFSDGSLHIFDTYKIPLLDSHDKIYGALGIARDVTERLDLETKLHQAATVFDNSNEGIFITDADANITAVNKAFSRITGYAEEEVLGQNPHLLASGKHDLLFYKNMWNELKAKGHWQGEITNKHKNGHLYPEWKTISVVKNDKDVVINYVAAFSDISELKKSQKALEYIAQHDQLTELPNRYLLITQLEQAILRAKRNKLQIALLFLDLDNFKQINDTLGHSIGDQVLKDVALKFKACIREEDIISRQGGDEFLVILEALHDPKEASVIAQKLINSLQKPFSINQHDFYIGVSIGISLFPGDGISSEQLIQNADTAMYQSKSSLKNSYSYFTPQLNQSTERLFKLENYLRVALEKNEIYVVYQPQIDIKDNQIYGFEALIRWAHPDLGLISPVEFIPIAESTGLINKIGQFVLYDSIKQIQYWNKKFKKNFCISVNISSRQFDNDDLPELINSLLIQHQCPAKYLKLEITESLLLQENSRVLELLTTIAKSKVQIALDDFGTGYSSLSYLKKYPINIVKIDQSFIRDIIKDEGDAILVKTIILMAEGLGMKTIAEGVETIEQLNYLKLENCHLIQGYYYSKPLKEHDVEVFLLNWN